MTAPGGHDPQDEDQLRRSAKGGDSAAACKLADMLGERGDVDGAVAVLSLYSRHPVAGRYLAGLLEWQGRADEALPVLRILADDGTDGASPQLVDLLASLGQVSELNQRASRGDRYAAERCAEQLAARGGDDVLASRVRRGDRLSAGYLATWHAGRGDIDEAIAVLRRCARKAPAKDVNWLVTVTMRRRPWDEPIGLKARADNGSPAAAGWLAGLLVCEGRISNLEDRARTGDATATTWLAGLRSADARLGQTTAELRYRSANGDDDAALGLARLLAWRGSNEEAVLILQRLTGDGNWKAAELLRACW